MNDLILPYKTRFNPELPEDAIQNWKELTPIKEENVSFDYFEDYSKLPQIEGYQFNDITNNLDMKLGIKKYAYVPLKKGNLVEIQYSDNGRHGILISEKEYDYAGGCEIVKKLTETPDANVGITGIGMGLILAKKLINEGFDTKTTGAALPMNEHERRTFMAAVIKAVEAIEESFYKQQHP